MIKGIKSSVPIMIGYFPVAMTFGVLAKGQGFDLIDVVCFSFVLFAGASQFIGLSMIHLGAGFGEIVLATGLLNFRHFFMSASLVSQMKPIPNRLKPLLSFFMTDEIFSVASFAGEDLTPSYLFGLEITSYLSWGIGSVMGFVLGHMMSQELQMSMGIGLYALFVSILTPEIKKTSKALILASLAGAMNYLLFIITSLPQGWRIIGVIVLSSALGVVLLGDGEKNE